MFSFHLTLLVALLALTTFTVNVQASGCPVLNQPQLCGTPDVTMNVTQCNSTTVNFPDFPACCRLQTEIPKKCDDPSAKVKCRNMIFGQAICPSDNPEFCAIDCFKKEARIKLQFSWVNTTRTCCSKCQCYGDPHCESFTGVPDTWVICDARKPKKTDKTVCPMDKDTCTAQLDHLGKNCTWLNPSASWNIGLQGSPCVFTPSPTPPQMTMYAADGFSVVLNMGERSVIKDIIIKDGSNQYVMSADVCFSSVGSLVVPWRVNTGDAAPPADPNWLPKTWAWSPLDGGDVFWQVTDLASQIEIGVRCTRTVVLQAGRLRAGPPRLNVDIVEPLNWQDKRQRNNTSGICPDQIITKQGSHAHTDDLLKISACQTPVDDLAVAQAICGAGTTSPGVDQCKLRWCKEVRPLEFNTACLTDIAQYRWDNTFCAAYTLTSKQASACSTSSLCRACVNDINDFGWAAAILKYSGGITGTSGCANRGDLPEDLVGCQTGVRVQYQLPGGEWETQFAIPQGMDLCGGYVEITKTNDPQLFMYPMRINQCTTPKTDCLVDNCSEEIGFKASFQIEIVQNYLEDVFNLFYAGDLICDPAKWPNNKHGCLGFVPPAYCPCPTGRRLLKGSD